MSDTSGSAADVASGAGNASPGKLLAAGRLARELTIEEIGDALNLSPQTVSWLEADEYASLPTPAFTQGYVRNYAKHVGLDADAVVAVYQKKAGKPDVSWESPRGNAGIAEIVQRHPGMLISVVVAAVVLLIVVVLAVVWPDDSDVDPDSDAEANPEIGLEVAPNPRAEPALQGVSANPSASGSRSDSSPPSSAPSSRDAASAIGAAPAELSGGRQRRSGRFDDPEGGVDRDAIDPNDPLAHLPVAKTYPVDRSQAETSSATATAPAPVRAPASSSSSASRETGDTSSAQAGNYRRTIDRRLTPAGEDKIRVEVTEDCWISIKTVEDEVLYALLGRPGQTINLTGQGPFRVLLGYAPGASLYLADREILLEPYTRNNVASLVIGQ